MDPFFQGVDVYLGRTDTDIHHSVRALLPYVVFRGNQPGPFYAEKNRRMLTRVQYNAKVDQSLQPYG